MSVVVTNTNLSFNEAGGFLPRKLITCAGCRRWIERDASMRPGDFSPGNPSSYAGLYQSWSCFNEAGGFLPRKRPTRTAPGRTRPPRFNEAGGFLPRKQRTASRRSTWSARRHRFNEAGGFLPRKRRSADRNGAATAGGFNEAGGFLPRKPDVRDEAAADLRMLQ